MNITVLIPTFKRPENLRQCLNGLLQQVRKPDEALVVCSASDEDTISFLQNFNSQLPLKVIYISGRGQVSQLNAGIKAAEGEIIAITDDDAVPQSNWLAQIENSFLAGGDGVAGVGGRDIVHHGSTIESGNKRVVGKVLWYGKIIGNHHIGVGNARYVDALKGANCAYRKSAIIDIGFDKRLLGSGAQVHNDLGLGLSLRHKGLQLIYDPKILVDHYPAERFDDDQRKQFNSTAICNAVHNETLILFDYLGSIQRVVYIFWFIFIGTRVAPGLLQCIRFFPSQGNRAIQHLKATLIGRWQGWQTWRLHKKSTKT